MFIVPYVVVYDVSNIFVDMLAVSVRTSNALEVVVAVFGVVGDVVVVIIVTFSFLSSLSSLLLTNLAASTLGLTIIHGPPF